MIRIKSKDIVGNKYGHLEVIARADDYTDKNGVPKAAQFKCKCDCGNIKVIKAASLKSGHTQSCGCIRSKSMVGVNLENLEGKVFGRWLVVTKLKPRVEPSGRKATMWLCRCSCGNEQPVRASSLKNGSSKSCGCFKSYNTRDYQDLTGGLYGRWLVMSRGEDYISPKGRHFRRWLCVCDCGSQSSVLESSLLKGTSLSCGCLRHDVVASKSHSYDDLTGKTFGSWLVQHRSPDRFYPGGGRAMMWSCKCQCGTITDVAAGMLKGGISKSCGCIKRSAGEDNIEKYLSENNYDYIKQYRIPGLVGIGNQLLSYDFAIIKNNNVVGLIEYQGEQHFKPIAYFGGDSKFKIQQEHDLRKKQYAMHNNIKLIEITYNCNSYLKVQEVLDLELTNII